MINGKQRWLLFPISLWSSNAAFVQTDCPLILFKLFIFFRSTIAKISNIFLFSIDFFTPLKFFLKIKIWVVSFVILAGKRIPRGVVLWTTFLYFFHKSVILSSFISTSIGYNPPLISKFCCALTIIVSFGSYIFLFLFSPSLVIEKWWILLPLVFTSDPLICASWNCKLDFNEFFSIKNFKNCLNWLILGLKYWFFLKNN